MKIDLKLRFNLFKEYLENGGIKKIDFVQILESLKQVRLKANGDVIPKTLDPIIRTAMNAYVSIKLFLCYTFQIVREIV